MNEIEEEKDLIIKLDVRSPEETEKSSFLMN